MGLLSALQATGRGKRPRMVGDSMYMRQGLYSPNYTQKPGFSIPGMPSPDDQTTDEEAAMKMPPPPPIQPVPPDTMDAEAQTPETLPQPPPDLPPQPAPGPQQFDFPGFNGPDGTQTQVGTTRSPQPSLLGRTLPRILSGAINAAATPNIAGGGPTDIFRAMQASQGAQERKDMLAYSQRRQQTQDALAAKKQADAAAAAKTRADAYSASVDAKADPKTVEQMLVKAISETDDPAQKQVLMTQLSNFKNSQAMLTNYQEVDPDKLEELVAAGIQPVLKDGKYYVLKSTLNTYLSNQSKEAQTKIKAQAQVDAAGLKDPMNLQMRYLRALPENKNLSDDEIQAKAAAQVIDSNRSKLMTTEEKNARAAGVDMKQWYQARIDNLVARTKKAQVSAAGGPTSDFGTQVAASDNPVLDIQALSYLANGTFEVRGRGGPEMRAEVSSIKNRANQIIKQLNLTPAEIMALRTDRKAAIPALAKVTSYDAMIGAFEHTLKNNIGILKTLADKVDSGDVAFLNKFRNAFNRGTGDPDIVKLAGQVHTVSSEWAKIMIGSTGAMGVPITEIAQMNTLINEAMSKGQLHALIDENGLIQQDINSRRNANRVQLDETRAQINSLSNRMMPGAPGMPPPPPPPNPQAPPPNPAVVQQQLNPKGAPPIKFVWNGISYTVPAEKAQKFLQEHPGATTR